MRLNSPETLSSICSWPYQPSEPYISEQGDMADSLMQQTKDLLIKSNNNEAVAATTKNDSIRKWSDGDIGPIGLESDEPSYPNSPNSPKKLESHQVSEFKCNQLNETTTTTIPSIFLNAAVDDDCSQEQQTEDDFSDDGTLSAYYVPSTGSAMTDEAYSQPPSAAPPPPRSSRTARLCRDQTQSEADASPAASVPYKSSRSKSDPSTHYTTVIKPTAIRPAINHENRNSFESLQTSAGFMQHARGQRSAFREHLRRNNSNEPVLVFFSRSLETSLGNEDSSLLSPTRRFSFNDAPNQRIATLNNCARTSSVQPLECSASSSRGQQRENSRSSSPECHHHTSLPCNVPNGHLPNSCSATPLFNNEPIHMTLEEVRNTLQGVESNSNDNQDQSPEENKKSPSICRQFFTVYFRPRKSKKSVLKQSYCRAEAESKKKSLHHHHHLHHHRRSFPSSMKAAISNWFGLRRSSSTNTPKKRQKMEDSSNKKDSSDDEQVLVVSDELAKSSVNTSPFTNRALPPLPVEGSFLWEPAVRVVEDETSSLSSSSLSSESDNNHNRTRKMDYAASIEKVKDCGWYWGPISGETAEKLLAHEPDGSFVVRDSSDEHYIFSLTFKLNGFVRHVRIEHDHGNFSFGCQQKFRSNTIVDFIENAVEHSRSGRYLFFLHRRPVLGPMRVQLLHPVSRFKQVQSLQHLCRFVIVKSVRRDLIDSLPLPRCLREYLNTPHYYSEELAHQSLVVPPAAADEAAPVSSLNAADS